MNILNQAGQVTSFRLMTDSNTGKPRGYGFATYADADSAASAVRNLNDHEVGGRKIRVDWPHQNTKDSALSGGDAGGGDVAAAAVGALNGLAGQAELPPVPPGVDLPPNIKATDAISQTLNTLPPQTLLDVLTQMKSLAISEPAKTTELLRQQPKLAYAIFQALLLMGLVDEKIFQQVLEQQSRAPAPMPAQPPPMIPPPQQTPLPYAPPPQQHPQYPGFPPPPFPGQQMPAMPPRPIPQYGAPPPIPQQQPPPQPQPQFQPSQDQLIQQILSMDQRTIDSLQPTERQQVLAIRAQYGR